MAAVVAGDGEVTPKSCEQTYCEVRGGASEFDAAAISEATGTVQKQWVQVPPWTLPSSHPALVCRNSPRMLVPKSAV